MTLIYIFLLKAASSLNSQNNLTEKEISNPVLIHIDQPINAQYETLNNNLSILNPENELNNSISLQKRHPRGLSYAKIYKGRNIPVYGILDESFSKATIESNKKAEEILKDLLKIYNSQVLKVYLSFFNIDNTKIDIKDFIKKINDKSEKGLQLLIQKYHGFNEFQQAFKNILEKNSRYKIDAKLSEISELNLSLAFCKISEWVRTFTNEVSNAVEERNYYVNIENKLIKKLRKDLGSEISRVRRSRTFGTFIYFFENFDPISICNEYTELVRSHIKSRKVKYPEDFIKRFIRELSSSLSNTNLADKKDSNNNNGCKII